MKLEVPKGKMYGYLKAVKEVPKKGGRRYFRCKCTYDNCENIKEIRLSHLNNNSIVSCGCYNDFLTKTANTKHGLRKNPLYNVWINMKQRCLNKNHSLYDRYGGRGIKLCKEWQIDKNYNGLKNFIAWNENLPKAKQYKPGLELDRKNNDEGYYPENCRWVTYNINLNNRRNTIYVTYKNRKLALSYVLAKYGKGGFDYKSAYYRHRQGWSINKIIRKSIELSKNKATS